MPTPPSTYTSGPLSAQQFNSDMYSANATFTGATGVLFHSRRPLLSETVISGGTAYSGLIQQPVDVAGIQAYTVVDNGALYGIGSDWPGVFSVFHFRDFVPSSNGALGGYGGQWLTWNFPYTQSVTNPPGGVGAGMFVNGALSANGVFQYGTTGHNNCPWYLDLISPGYGSTNTWQPSFWWLTASTPVITGNDLDSSGQVPRMGWLWQGVSTGGATVGTVPVPVTSWGTVTSSALNTTLGSCLTMLNNPPMLRVTQASSATIPTAAAQVISLNVGANVDNYSSWNSSNGIYTIPLPGLYLFSPMLGWGTTSSSGIRWTGLNTVGGGTAPNNVYQGPAYKATPVGPGVSGVGMTGTSVVRVMNLKNGDEVLVVGFQDSGSNLPLLPSYGSRLIGAYMGQTAAAGTVLTYAPPNISFRWQAGALSGTALTAALNLHLGQDMSFLMNRPYFTGYQTSAQTFGTASVFNKITMDTLGAPPNGGNGDNYGGWNASAHSYASQVAGWYLCIADLYATPPVSGTVGVVTAGFSVSTSGGITPLSTPDQYQQVYYPVSTGGPPPGATAIGMYYLEQGETIYPVMQTQGWGGTWGTYVSNSTTQVYSQFSCFWVSELGGAMTDQNPAPVVVPDYYRTRHTFIVPVLMIILCFVAYGGGTVAYVLWSVSESEHKWCSTIDLLNEAPPPQGANAANPSREYEMQLSKDFRTLKGRLGC